ncbi:Eco57I restriction-modification methylase domain-containing protein [Actinokineospora cianjurensis]|uniref:site-specific DNA-methyltransferase (adenine-specific) n=1 Tax=Actinokineospora cianjurensis TaxID=585224 RepID=A0A421B821_9PSEU|nr:methyltransferase domain-containing protein [Actinokineospora cianjurensis]RLK60415.1 methyltransferase family protein [Actinokineospora cianjurensis]
MSGERDRAGAAVVKRQGRHYTPVGLAGFLAAGVVRHLPVGGVVRVLDPACGDGELLLGIVEVLGRVRPGVVVEVTGFDVDGEALGVAGKRAAERGVVGDWREGDFVAVAGEIPGGSFDVVITNPPYVRTQQLGAAVARVLARDFNLVGRIDLTHPFISTFPRLLRAGGVMGLLCSNRFLSTRAGANVRGMLGGSLTPVEVYDLGDTRLFAAAVLPAIVIATAECGPVTCRFVSAYRAEGAARTSGDTLFEALRADVDSVVEHGGKPVAVRVGELAERDDPAQPWRFSQHDHDWLARVEAATWKTFGAVGKIRVGVKTTADAVFIREGWPDVEPELVLPLVTHEDVTPWQVGQPRTKVLYPYDLSQVRRTPVDLTKFPKTTAYLESHAERLKGRKYVTDAGRLWWEIWVPQRPGLWAVPKVVFPDISERARFAYDRSGVVVNGDCYWISLADIGDERLAYLMLGVANSALGLRFYDEVCGNRLYSGRRRWITQYVERFPLPDPRTAAAQELVNTVSELIEGRGDPTAVDGLVERAFGL